MKHDKHKAKNSANHKKKHGILPGKGENKTQRKVKEHGGSLAAQALAEEKESLSLIIEKQPEIYKVKEYARRKVESNWTKYEDFAVDDEREAEVSSEPRGEDFQKLAAKSDDASSQLRMKDEVWWDEDDQQDETETEIGELFKVDYVDLARRLKCIPLHERLGISTKYFDEDLLNRINEDAAEHAKSYQEILDAENAQDLVNPASSDTTDNQTRGPSEPTISASKNSCEIDRLQEVIVKDNNEQICHDASRTKSEREHCARDMEQTDSQVTKDRATTVSDGSCSHPDSQSSTSGSLATPSNKSALSADVKEPAAELQPKPDEEENHDEEWLDEFLDD